MELLFVWINHSKNGIYEQRGINFSPEYNFLVKKEGEYFSLVEDNTWIGTESIFKNDVIQNVSVIVGRNGIGKTTLLDFISSMHCFPPRKTLKKPGYEAMYDRDLKNALCVYIFKKGMDIVVYHNFETGFTNETRYEVKRMSDEIVCRDILRNKTDFRDVFRIYITNSYYGSIQKNNISQNDKLDEIALTPAGISTISTIFFDNLLETSNSTSSRNFLYLDYLECLKAYLQPMQFQMICDLLYFSKLLKEGNFENYALNISTKLCIKCTSYQHIIEKYNRRLDTFEVQGIFKWSNKQFEALKDKENEVIINLLLNLIFEIWIDLDGKLPEKEVNTLKDGLEWIENVLESTSRVDYFKDAINEIKELGSILKMAQPQENVVPEYDLAYDRSLVIDYEYNKEAYIMFLDFIEERFAANHSIALRYLSVGSIGMSSGERAFQNIFSWINLLPQFHSIDSTIPKEMKNNVLFLIDEIDLYMHPEWQKDFLSILLDEVKQQFAGYKVQIIMTTHSPLCLSDIPRENTVYLSEESGHVKIDDRKDHMQTFGKDLYSLLNDAFYLKDSTMGNFAKQYIESIISRILDEDSGKNRNLSLEEVDEIKKQIDVIGNELLSRKLKAMVEKCLSHEDELQLLINQKENIEKRIMELENK